MRWSGSARRMDSELTATQKNPEPSLERELLDRFRAGDRSAFQSLVRPHLGSLMALGRRLAGDAHWGEDLTQETLVRAFRGLDGFRAEGSFRTWLFRIQVRLASEPQRWRRSERAVPTEGLDVPDHLGEGPEQPAITRELRDRLEEAMERLPARQRAALHLRAHEGLGYTAIGGAMACSPGAARMLVLEARRRVMARMGRFLTP